MGQDQSGETGEISTERLSQELALKFAAKCYTRLELYCFKEVFRKLADIESGVRYWTEGTLCRFLELPDALSAGPVIYHMATMLGAFPFMSQAPCIITMDALLRVITLLTERYKKVLKGGSKDRFRLLFNSLAVYDRSVTEPVPEQVEGLDKGEVEQQALIESIKGFDIDQPANDDDVDENNADDGLALAALDSLDGIDAFNLDFGDRPKIQNSIIPSDNFLRLLELMLLIAPLRPQESISQYSDQLGEEVVQNIRQRALAILSSFDVETHPGVSYESFKTVISNSLPYVFDGLNPLFEHFLFEKDFDLAKRKASQSADSPVSPISPTSPSKIVASPTSPTSAGQRRVSTSYFGSKATPNETDPYTSRGPLLEKAGEILTMQTMTQISFFISPSTVFGRMFPLYSGAADGFSLGSFENAVFSWKAPSLLLVSGILLPEEPRNSRERAMADSMPPRRFPSSDITRESGTRVTYGAYIPVPWKHTNRACFGDASTTLFQLEPMHDVFHASDLSRNYISFLPAAPSTIHPGINFGTPLPSKADHNAQLVPLGPVSLYLDSSLEFAAFTHTAQGGGSFHPSVSPARAYIRKSDKASNTAGSGTESSRRRSSSAALEGDHHGGNWQDRFEIESLEVWGFGGPEEAERRRRNREFEAREARNRKESIAGKGAPHETDREILRMAGLIGHGQGGGSMQ